MLSIGKFTESEVWSSSGSWTEHRDDQLQHELELDGEAPPGSRGGGNIASRDGLKILSLSTSDNANNIRRRVDGKRILLVIDGVLFICGKRVMRQAVSHNPRQQPHRSIAVRDLTHKYLCEYCRDFLRRQQLWTSGTIRLSCMSFWPCENLSRNTGHILVGRRSVE